MERREIILGSRSSHVPSATEWSGDEESGFGRIVNIPEGMTILKG
jgi:hypothetical protein